MTTSRFNARHGISIGTTPVDLVDASGNITAGTINGSSITVTGAISGTSLTGISSSTLVTNLNADKLDGNDGTYYTTAGNLTGTISSTVLGNSTHYIGTTAITLNRASAAQSLTGITSIDGSAASCSGNAATATTLQTGRTINGVSFNGSANITVGDDITNDTATATALYPVFVGGTGAQTTKIINTANYFSYTPSTGTLSIKAISVTDDVGIAHGGTGASTAAAARTNLDVDQAGTAVSMAIALG